MASAFWLHVLAWEPLSSQSCRTNCCSSHILPRSEEGQTEETKGGRPETPRTAAFAQPLLSQGLALSLGYVQTKGGISPKSAWGHHRHPPMTDTRCRGKGSSCWFSSEAGPPGHRAPPKHMPRETRAHSLGLRHHRRGRHRRAHGLGHAVHGALTFMTLLRHSSATILTSDSASSLHSRKSSIAMPRSF